MGARVGLALASPNGARMIGRFNRRATRSGHNPTARVEDAPPIIALHDRARRTDNPATAPTAKGCSIHVDSACLVQIQILSDADRPAQMAELERDAQLRRNPPVRTM